MSFEQFYDDLVESKPAIAKTITITPENFRKALKLAYSAGLDAGMEIGVKLEQQNNPLGKIFGAKP